MTPKSLPSVINLIVFSLNSNVIGLYFNVTKFREKYESPSLHWFWKIKFILLYLNNEGINIKWGHKYGTIIDHTLVK